MPIRVLHVYENAINLIAEDGEIVSLVEEGVGNGPFNIVLPDLPFTDSISTESKVAIQNEIISLDDWLLRWISPRTIVWDPKYLWDSLDNSSVTRILVLSWLIEFLTIYQRNDFEARTSYTQKSSFTGDLNRQLFEEAPKLFAGIADQNFHAIGQSASRIAGLGSGITPDGDDLLLGAILAVWWLMAEGVAIEISERIRGSVQGRTTTISEAWLYAAASGECTEKWHRLFNAIKESDKLSFFPPAVQIYHQGFTSGWRALQGFKGVLGALQE